MSFWIWLAITIEMVGTFVGGVTATWYWLGEAVDDFSAYMSGLFWAILWPLWLMYFAALILYGRTKKVSIHLPWEHRDVRRAKRQVQLARIAAERAEAEARRDRALGL